MLLRFKKTFIGADGREYINNPNLSFPLHVKVRRKGTDPKSGQPYSGVTKAFVETASVASRLRCSASATRQYLYRHGVRFRVIRKSTGSLCICWHQKDVDKVLSNREPICQRIPEGFVSMADAIRILGVVRSYVFRLAKKGLLKEYRCRMKTARGFRIRCFYHLADLDHVKRHVLQKRTP